MLRFKFSEQKAVEVLTHIASEWPHVTVFYVAKILFFAEKAHLNRYARPIVGDTFVAMPNGPVPSTIYDFIKGNLDQAGDPGAFVAALEIHKGSSRSLRALRTPDYDVLSLSDIECLNEAIGFCRTKRFGVLSDLTHQERAWLDATSNGPIDYEHMVEPENLDAVAESAQEFAAHGVL